MVRLKITNFLTFFQLSFKDFDFSSKDPVDHGKGFLGSVVAWDCAIHELKGIVCIGKSNNGDVHV